MNFLLDIPRFKAYCDRSYMTDGSGKGMEEVYIFAVTLLEGRPLLFTCHTEFGAVYSRLPIIAFHHSRRPQTASVDRWGAISGNGTCVQHTYLKDYRCKLLRPHPNTMCMYHCTIDYYNGGFAQDPEQHKTSNILFGDDGAIYILPNNEILFLDEHFTKPSTSITYKRNTKYFI